jgi:hypothetical protein
MTIESQLPLVEEILATFSLPIGRDLLGYRNHVYRVIHLCYAAGEFALEDQHKIQIAACFHDIGLWTATTLDYLPPSTWEAVRYLRVIGKEAWIPEVTEMIDMHHGIRSRASSPYPLTEVFRRADIADFSLGLVRMGLPRELIAALKSAFPNAGFHRRLMLLGCKWLIRHPFRPLPMFRL